MAESQAPDILSGLKARRAAAHEQIRNRHLDLELPSYGGELVVRYRPPEWEETQVRMERLLTSSGRDRLYAGVDLMIAACEMVLIRVPDATQKEGTRLVPLHEAVTDDPAFSTPVRFDERLCKAVGIEPPAGTEDAGPGRMTVLAVVDDDYAVGGQASAVASWLTELTGIGRLDF